VLIAARVVGLVNHAARRRAIGDEDTHFGLLRGYGPSEIPNHTRVQLLTTLHRDEHTANRAARVQGESGQPVNALVAHLFLIRLTVDQADRPTLEVEGGNRGSS